MTIKKVTKLKAFNSKDFRAVLAYIIDRVDGSTTTLLFRDGEPEDGTLYRDFSDTYNFFDILKEAVTSENVVFEEKDFGDDWSAFHDAI
jgi:hypothetical protein